MESLISIAASSIAPSESSHFEVCGRAHLVSPERTLGPSHAFGLRFLPRKCYDVYRLDRDARRQTRESDYVFVNLFRTPLGEPMTLRAATNY